MSNSTDPSERGYVFYSSSPLLRSDYASDPDRPDSILDSSGFAITEVFLDYVISGNVLPDSVLGTFELGKGWGREGDGNDILSTRGKGCLEHP